MCEEKLCHRQGGEKSVKVAGETNCDTENWKQYGDLLVRTSFGDESITELLVSYAEGLASLKH